MSGHWPPDWEDPEEGNPEEAGQLDATVLAEGGEARLSEVAACLAAVPVPVLPGAVEARISAAIAAEAATRADAAGEGSDATPADASSRRLAPGQPRARMRRRRGGGQPRRDFRRPALAGVSLVACLLLAGLVLTLSRTSSSSSSSAAIAGGPAAAGSAVASAARSDAAPEPAASSALTAAGHVPTATAPVPTKSALPPTASAPAPARSSPAPTPSASAPKPSASKTSGPTAAPTMPAPSPTASVSFVVTASGTNYQAATLAAQVRARLNAPGGSGTSPTAALQGCVSHLAGGQSPRLVDQAAYQGSAAYIIATPSHAWVTGLGCTAAKPELIASVPLAGLPGNLRALVSVEQ